MTTPHSDVAFSTLSSIQRLAAACLQTLSGAISRCRLLLALGIALTLGVPAALARGTIEPQPRAGEPLNGLSANELARFEAGRVQYLRTFTAGEGLGPIFNKESCANCHNNPVGGTGGQTVTRFGLAGKKGFDSLDMFGGSLLQSQSIDPDNCAEEIPIEANRISFRVTNGMMGYGLVEAIPDADITSLASNTPPITGRVHTVESFEAPGVPRAGRFGWKAQVATILTFSADAALNEIGITNRFLMTENDPNGINPPDIGDCDIVPDPEDDGLAGGGLDFIDAVTDFQRFLAPPPQTPRGGMTGESIFNTIGCAQCHTPQFTTGATTHDGSPLEAALASKTIRPYSDFLLHSVGSAADGIEQGAASEFELRTPPLWGLRRRDPIWHDGRFGAGTMQSRVHAAILAHGFPGSEATAVVSNYNALTATEKDQLFAFFDSLGKAEFDADGNDIIDRDDFLNFLACVGSGPYLPDHLCAIHDIDQDGDVDDDDFTAFLISYDIAFVDCNKNGINDVIDLYFGSAADVNANGIPDSCECPADCVPPGGDGQVTIADINSVLAHFGLNNPQFDISPIHEDGSYGDGAVTIADITAVLSSFGPCVLP